MTEKQTYDVLVHKAQVAVKRGESLQAFVQKVRIAGSAFITQQLNLDPKNSDVFAIEVFSTTAIFDVFLFGSVKAPNKKQRFFAVSYTRKADGEFEFKNLTEVDRVVSFAATAKVPVLKSMDGAEGWASAVDVRKAKSTALWAGADII